MKLEKMMNLGKGVFSLWIILCLFSTTQLFGQRPLGNEWIHYDQSYFKIKVAGDSLCRISYRALQNANVPLSQINPSEFQLFYRGEQVPIYVSAPAGKTFDSTDYILFVGRKNDGALDSVLYENPAELPSKGFSTYTDTSAYFFTWGTKDSSLRFEYYDKPYTTGTTPATYTEEAVMNLSDQYNYGTPLSSLYNYYGSEYNSGEGWMSKPIGLNQKVLFTIQTPNFVSAVSSPEIEMLVYGISDDASANPDHELVISVGAKSNALRLIVDTIYNGFARIPINSILLNRDIATTCVVQVQSKGYGTSNTDYHAVAYIKVRYARDFNFAKNELRFFNFTDNTSNDETRFKFFGNGLGGQPPMYLLDLTNNYISDGHYIGKDVFFNLPNTKTSNHYLLLDKRKISEVSLSKVNFTKPDINGNYNYLIITNAILKEGVNEFAAYKSTQKIDENTNFKPYTVYVDDLYDQFFYGCRHPAAIQNFLAYYVKNASVLPSFLFLMGKGQDPTNARKNVSMDLVPTVGLPSSDIKFVSGIPNGFEGKETDFLPPFPIGRLSAHNNDEIRNYLNKLKEYDAAPIAMWKKNVVHVGGGEPAQQATIRAKLIQFGKTVSGPFTGCNVKSVFSNNSDPVYIDGKTLIQKYINDGASLFTYLGHGAANLLGVDIGKLDSLKNKGKYPIMYFNGCNVGDIGAAVSMGELYLSTPDKGAIAWLGHSNNTFDGLLFSQMQSFYSLLSKSPNNSTALGDIWLSTLNASKLSYKDDVLARCNAYQWIIQGDPSINFKFLSKPDYGIFDSTLHISPPFVLASDDSFAVTVPIVNFGSTDTSRIVVRVEHHLPDGTVTIYPDYIMNPIRNTDTAFIWIKRDQRKLEGNNTFCVNIDPDKNINELTWANNKACFSYLFPGTGARCLYPLNYGIVNNTSPQLLAQSKNLFDNEAAVIFQIDTTPNFNSTFLITSPPVPGSNLVSFNPKLLTKDTTVYYWRTRMSLDSSEWDLTRSFTYIKGSPDGWSQSEWPQFKEIKGTSVTIDTTKKYFSYLSKFKQARISANPFNMSGLGVFTNDDYSIQYCTPSGHTIMMSVFDRTTLAPVSLSTTKNCFAKDPPFLDVFFTSYNMRDSVSRQNFVEDVRDIPNGNYALITGFFYDQQTEKWEENVFHAFSSLGVKRIRTDLKDSMGFIIGGQKGTPQGILLTDFNDASKREAEVYVLDTFPDRKNPRAFAPNMTDVAAAEVVMTGILNKRGYITSEPIGPATKWKTAIQYFKDMEDSTQEDVELQIIGIDKTGKDSVLFTGIRSHSFDISSIDPEIFPYLKLRAILSDSIFYTPPQLKLWQVLFDAIPEGTLSTKEDFSFHADTLFQGDSIRLKIKFTNISKIPMKEVLVRTSVYNFRNSLQLTHDSLYAAIGAGQSLVIDEKLSSRNLIGGNILTLFVNPDFNQPEITLDNNFIKIPFYVKKDITNPVLEVTFDGEQLYNGAIIRPNPTIKVRVKDENRILLLNDTATFNLTLNKANGSANIPIYFSDSAVHFTPATSFPNIAEITYNPQLSDGTYVFTAQAKDLSGNTAGTEPYTITFKVITASTISSIYMYPNPLTYISHFRFTLTGSSIPETLLIKVYSLAGQEVAEIGKNRMGKLRIGENEFTWDATDYSGRALPNGLYIYKVFVKDANGNNLKPYTFPHDNRIDKAYGKILILKD